MAYIQQEYPIGQDFSLSTQTQLSGEDSVWKWDRRTLSGFMTEDGTFIEAGGTANFDGQQAQVSGIWTMDKGRPFGLNCLGESGSISVTFEITSNQPPLADGDHPFVSSVTLTSTESLDTYKWTDIVAHIDVAPGTIVKSISAYQWNTTSQVSLSNIMPSIIELSSKFKVANNNQNQNYWDYYRVPFGISVDYTNRGVLEYVPNIGVYIPTDDNPAN